MEEVTCTLGCSAPPTARTNATAALMGLCAARRAMRHPPSDAGRRWQAIRCFRKSSCPRCFMRPEFIADMVISHRVANPAVDHPVGLIRSPARCRWGATNPAVAGSNDICLGLYSLAILAISDASSISLIGVSFTQRCRNVFSPSGATWTVTR